MHLAPGTQLGHYEITEPIGAGGMGEVYRARDTKLGRDVAIKVLPEEFSQHRERLDRFEREAKLLAALNHANIATLFGLEESEGQQFLVMELVEGETLAERIARGPIPVDEALPLFIQMAEGLESAHAKGIVHRDLKPANAKITPDGKIKILDFGLAKAFAPDENVSVGTSQSPTLTKGTALGAIMGTASYMSPEQAKGRTTDQRTDIWAFGCVLFEALTGRKAFPGDDVSEILASVLRDEPDWAAAPSSLSKLLRRCVHKDVRQRFQHIGDVRVDLGEIAAGPELPSSVRMKSSSLPLGLALLITLGALGLAAWGWLRSPPRITSGVTRSTIELEYPFAWDANRPALAISRDGARLLAIVDTERSTQVYVHELSQASGRLLPGTEGAQGAFFSPDGQSIGFVAPDNFLYTVSLLGGAPVRWALVSPVTRGGAWVTEDQIVMNPSTDSGLAVVSGANRTVLTSPDIEAGERSHRWPQAMPGSPDDVLFTVGTTGSFDEAVIAVASLETGDTRIVLEGGYAARVTASGHLVFGRAGALMVTPIDVDTLDTGAAPVTVIEKASDADVPTSWSSDGAVLAFTAVGDQDIWTFPLQGGAQPTPLIQSDFNEAGASFSSDGKWLAYHSDESGRREVYVQTFPGSGTKQLVSSDGGTWPQWSESGKKLFYRNGDRMMQVDVTYGSSLELSRPRLLFAGKYSYGDLGHSNDDVSEDGRFLMIRTDLPPPTNRLWLVTNWFEELERLVPTEN